jgi:hypothetical protein
LWGAEQGSRRRLPWCVGAGPGLSMQLLSCHTNNCNVVYTPNYIPKLHRHIWSLWLKIARTIYQFVGTKGRTLSTRIWECRHGCLFIFCLIKWLATNIYYLAGFKLNPIWLCNWEYILGKRYHFYALFYILWHVWSKSRLS